MTFAGAGVGQEQADGCARPPGLGPGRGGHQEQQHCRGKPQGRAGPLRAVLRGHTRRLYIPQAGLSRASFHSAGRNGKRMTVPALLKKKRSANTAASRAEAFIPVQCETPSH